LAERSAPGGPIRVFVLGCERSGSTWLANILCAHPDVAFYMEPFYRRTGLFEALPGRNVYLGNAAAPLAEAVREGFARLDAAKHALFYRPGASAGLLRLDRAIASVYADLVRWTGVEFSRKLARHAALNLNTLEVPFRPPGPKRRPPRVEAVKELRLNFKVGLLDHAFPKARYLVILRHPGAQIAAILRQFEKGRLGELRESLLALPDTLRGHDRFTAYWGAEADELAADPRAALAFWWVVNYDVLLGDLAARGLPHHVVLHEDLSADPEGVVAGVLDFCGLPPDPEVTAYVRESSSRGPATGAAVDTYRVSGDFAVRAVREVPPELRRIVARVVRADRLRADPKSGLRPWLGRYFDPAGHALLAAVAPAPGAAVADAGR